MNTWWNANAGAAIVTSISAETNNAASPLLILLNVTSFRRFPTISYIVAYVRKLTEVGSSLLIGHLPRKTFPRTPVRIRGPGRRAASGSGMGAACARELAGRGHAVAPMSPSGKAEALAEGLGGFGSATRPRLRVKAAPGRQPKVEAR